MSCVSVVCCSERDRERSNKECESLSCVVVKCTYINSHLVSSCLSEWSPHNSQALTYVHFTVFKSSNAHPDLKLATVHNSSFFHAHATVFCLLSCKHQQHQHCHKYRFRLQITMATPSLNPCTSINHLAGPTQLHLSGLQSVLPPSRRSLRDSGPSHRATVLPSFRPWPLIPAPVSVNLHSWPIAQRQGGHGSFPVSWSHCGLSAYQRCWIGYSDHPQQLLPR